MPYVAEKIRLPRKYDRRVKLTDNEKELIREISKYRLASQRKIARIFNVSRRLIQFIIDPEKQKENMKRRIERGGTKIYYDKKKHRDYIKEHRRYKNSLYREGLISKEE